MKRFKSGLNLIKQILIRLVEDDCFGQAKGAAYSFLFFFFPLLLFLVATLIVTDALALLSPQLTQVLSRVLPPGTRTLITDYISKKATSEPTNVLLGAFVAMVWTGSGMMASFIEGLDRAYRVAAPRSLVKQRLVAIDLVFLVGIPLAIMALLTIFGSHLERFIAAQFHRPMTRFWTVSRWGFVLMATMVMISFIYYVGPNRHQTWRGVLPGAALATTLWILATLGFSAYVDRFGEYDVLYGSLGAGIVLLIWMYLSSLVVLIGGEINAVLELGPEESLQIEHLPAEAPSPAEEPTEKLTTES